MLKNIDKYSDIFFKTIFVLSGFMFYSNIFFGYDLYSYAQTLTLGLGFLLLIYRWGFRREDFFREELIILFLFMFSHILSSVLNLKYGFYENFKVLVFMAFDFYLLFPTSREMKMTEYKNQFHWLLNIFILIATTASIVSLIMMIKGYGELVKLPPNNYEVLHGFMWGRLFGVYYDPNYGSTFTAIAVLGAIYLITNNQKNILYYLSIVPNYFYIIFSDSRTGSLALFVGMFLFIFIFLYKRKNWKFLILVLVLVSTFNLVMPKIVKEGYNQIIITQSQATQSKTTQSQTVKKIKDKRVGRENDLEGDFSNRRFDLWRSGLEIFVENKLVGVGFKNILPYMEENLPNTYAINNDNYSKFDNMHNLIFNVLPGQGIIGLITLLIIFIFFFLKLRILVFEKALFDQDLTSILIGICGIVGVSMMTVTDGVYVITPSSTMFWVSLGMLMKLFDQKTEYATKNKNILIGYYANLGVGGIDKYIDNMIDAVYEENIHIDCLTSNPSKELIDRLKEKNIGLYTIDRLTSPFKRYYETVNIVKQNSYDIAYFNISESFNCICNFAVKNYSNATIITHSHSSGNDETNKIKRSIIKLIHFCFRPVLRECTDYYYSCSSNASIWLFGRSILNSERHRIIRNTIDSSKFKFDEKNRIKIRRELNISDECIIVGFVGSFTYSKNVFYLIDVFYHLFQINNRYRLLMIGEGVLLKDAKEHCEMLGIKEYSHLIGLKKNIYKYYSAMDLFILPSNFEGLPIVGIEAQVNGLHCCFSNKIGEDVTICGNVSFHSITQTALEFAQELEKSKFNRENNPQYIEGVYYDVNKQKEEFKDILINRNM